MKLVNVSMPLQTINDSWCLLLIIAEEYSECVFFFKLISAKLIWSLSGPLSKTKEENRKKEDIFIPSSLIPPETLVKPTYAFKGINNAALSHTELLSREQQKKSK